MDQGGYRECPIATPTACTLSGRVAQWPLRLDDLFAHDHGLRLLAQAREHGDVVAR